MQAACVHPRHHPRLSRLYHVRILRGRVMAGCPCHHHDELVAVCWCTMMFMSTAKVLPKCKLKYYISECGVLIASMPHQMLLQSSQQVLTCTAKHMPFLAPDKVLGAEEQRTASAGEPLSWHMPQPSCLRAPAQTLTASERSPSCGLWMLGISFD